MRNFPKVFTHDQVGDRTPDLSFSGPTPTPLGHELITVLSHYYDAVTIYPVITMPGKYPGLRALLCHLNGYYDTPDILMYL
jgi:hypothetical protein